MKSLEAAAADVVLSIFHSYSISTDSYFDKTSLVNVVITERKEGWCQHVTVSSDVLSSSSSPSFIKDDE